MSIEDIEFASNDQPSGVLAGFAIVAVCAGTTGFFLGMVVMWALVG